MAVRCSIEGGLQPYLPVISSSGQQLESLYIFCGDDDDDEALEGLDIPGSQGAARYAPAPHDGSTARKVLFQCSILLCTHCFGQLVRRLHAAHSSATVSVMHAKSTM